MNPKFKLYIDNSKSVDNPSMMMDFTTNTDTLELISSIDNFYNKVMNPLLYSYWEIFFQYFYHMFNLYQYDTYELQANIESFPHPFNYSSIGKENIYSIFNIEYLKLHLTEYNNLVINKFNISEVNFDKTITNNYGKHNPNPPIIVESKFQQTYSMVDGNHRFIDRFMLTQSVNTKYIQYSNLNAKMFINKFNLAIYLFANESYELAKITQDNPEKLYDSMVKSIKFCKTKLEC